MPISVIGRLRKPTYGTVTQYEADVWERHFIDLHGGLRANNPASTLENIDPVISQKKYFQYKDMGLHQPC